MLWEMEQGKMNDKGEDDERDLQTHGNRAHPRHPPSNTLLISLQPSHKVPITSIGPPSIAEFGRSSAGENVEGSVETRDTPFCR